MILLNEIQRHFQNDDMITVSDLLGQYSGPEPTRVKRAVLDLAQGDMFRLRHYLDVAMTDYRDVLYWSEYADDNPNNSGRD